MFSRKVCPNCEQWIDNGVYHVDGNFNISCQEHGVEGKASKYDRDCRKAIGEFYERLEACIVKGMAD